MTTSLTPREIEVVALICQGLCSKEIAAELGISLHTVQTHRLNVMRKLHVDSGLKIVLWAFQGNHNGSTADFLKLVEHLKAKARELETKIVNGSRPSQA